MCRIASLHSVRGVWNSHVALCMHLHTLWYGILGAHNSARERVSCGSAGIWKILLELAGHDARRSRGVGIVSRRLRIHLRGKTRPETGSRDDFFLSSAELFQ